MTSHRFHRTRPVHTGPCLGRGRAATVFEVDRVTARISVQTSVPISARISARIGVRATARTFHRNEQVFDQYDGRILSRQGRIIDSIRSRPGRRHGRPRYDHLVSGKATSVVLLVAMIATIVFLDVAFLRDHFVARLVTNVLVALVFIGIALAVRDRN